MDVSRNEDFVIFVKSVRSVLSVGVALSLWGCGPQDDIAQTAAMLDAERAAARKEGIPVEPSDVFPDGKTPDAENAAITYLKAPDAMKSAEPVFGGSESLDGKVLAKKATAEELGDFRAVLATMKPYLAEVEAASRKPKVDFKRDWSLGARLLLPELAPLKKVVRLLCTRAVLRARDGDLVSARADLETAFRVSAHIGQEGLLINYLIQISSRSSALNGAVRIAKENPGSVQALSMAADVLARCPTEPNLLRALRGEAVGAILIARTVSSIEEIEALSGGGEPPAHPRFPLTQPQRQAAEVRLLQFWRKVLPPIAAHPDDFRAAEEVLKRESAAMEAHTEGSYLLAKVCLPILDVSATSKGRAQASTSVARALVFALDEKRKTGAWPKAVPADLTDPFSDKPLRFQATKDGFKVWSVGPNGVDEGGDRRSDAKPDADDIAMSYP